MVVAEKVIVECHDRSGLTVMVLVSGVAMLAWPVIGDAPAGYFWAMAIYGGALILFSARKLILPGPSWRVVARGDHLEWGRGDRIDGRVDLRDVIGYHIGEEHIAFQVALDAWVTLNAGSMTQDALRAIERYLIEERGMHDEKRGRPFNRPPGLLRR